MNQKHRIFIAINLPEDIESKLAKYQEEWPELSTAVRWAKKDNLHITLVFLGYVADDEILEICNLVKEVCQKYSSFLINLNKICYGPVAKIPPRMVWVEGESSEELIFLQNDLARVLGVNEERKLIPHITLGRIRQFEWRKIEPEEIPEIEQDINLNFEVKSVDIMESILKRGGPEYIVLESYNLK